VCVCVFGLCVFDREEEREKERERERASAYVCAHVCVRACVCVSDHPNYEKYDELVKERERACAREEKRRNAFFH